jgi:hypothetical protein
MAKAKTLDIALQKTTNYDNCKRKHMKPHQKSSTGITYRYPVTILKGTVSPNWIWLEVVRFYRTR